MGIDIQPPGPSIEPAVAVSTIVFGTVTAPGVSTTIVGTAALPDALYRIDVYVVVTGTVTVADNNNVKFVINGSGTAALAVQAEAAFSGTPTPITVYKRSGGGTILLVAVAAGGAAAVYSGTLIVTEVGQ